MTACHCQFCAGELEPAQELRYLVETDTLDNPAHLDRIRRLPAGPGGKPLRVCKGCQDAMEARPVQFRLRVQRDAVGRQLQSGMLAAVGVLSFGWFMTALIGDPRI